MTDETTDLDSGAVWLNFKIEDSEFEAELFDTVSLLAAIDRDHFDDLNECSKCQTKFTHRDGVDLKSRELVCTSCGATSQDIFVASKYLDDVAAMLKDRHKVKRCSQGQASLFYNKIVEEHDKLKKNATETVS